MVVTAERIAVAAHISNHAYYRDPVILVAARILPLEALPQRVFVGPIAPRHILVYDRNQRGVCVLLIRERAPAQQSSTHGLKIVSADRLPQHRSPVVTRLGEATINGTRAEVAHTA
jgi:hypothetical protein